MKKKRKPARDAVQPSKATPPAVPSGSTAAADSPTEASSWGGRLTPTILSAFRDAQDLSNLRGKRIKIIHSLSGVEYCLAGFHKEGVVPATWSITDVLQQSHWMKRELDEWVHVEIDRQPTVIMCTKSHTLYNEIIGKYIMMGHLGRTAGCLTTQIENRTLMIDLAPNIDLDEVATPPTPPTPPMVATP